MVRTDSEPERVSITDLHGINSFRTAVREAIAADEVAHLVNHASQAAHARSVIIADLFALSGGRKELPIFFGP